MHRKLGGVGNRNDGSKDFILGPTSRNRFTEEFKQPILDRPLAVAQSILVAGRLAWSFDRHLSAPIVAGSTASFSHAAEPIPVCDF